MVNLFLCLAVSVFVFETNPALAANDVTYKVVSGDNLTFIAKRFGVTLKSLRRANELTSDLLSIGQILKLDQPFAISDGKIMRWNAPCPKADRILRPFGNYKEKDILMTRTGVDLSCPVGSPVRAPATSVVRHIGVLDGFGVVMILEHFQGFATVYSPLNRNSIKVQEGQALKAGHLLGHTAESELDNSPPYLHLELRKDQKAVNPKPLMD